MAGEVSIFGKSEDDVQEATQAILQTQPAARTASATRAIEDPSDETDLSLASTFLQTRPEQQHEVVLPLPVFPGLLPRLIGKQRQREKELERLSGCTIHINDGPLPCPAAVLSSATRRFLALLAERLSMLRLCLLDDVTGNVTGPH